MNANPEELTVAEILYNDELDHFFGSELLEELRKTLIGRRVQVPTMAGNRTFINLDTSASTPTFTPFFTAFGRAFRQSEQMWWVYH